MSSEATRSRLRHGVTPHQKAARDNRRYRHLPAAYRSRPEVVDDLPNPIPVTANELDAIESYLGDQITRLLGRVSDEAPQPEKKTHDD